MNSSILIVDDEDINIEILSDLLQDMYPVKSAQSAHEALKVLDEHANEIDLILLDVIMPDTDGYKLCKQLKELPKTQNIPIIFVTSNDAPEDEEYGLSLGAVDYITKPYRSKSIKIKVFNHMELQEHRRRLELFNTNLKEQINHAVDKLHKQEAFIEQQAKAAAMGEMIDAIAHQWKTPLSVIQMYAQNIEMVLEDEALDKEEVLFSVEKILSQLNHAQETLNSFRSFFRSTQTSTILTLDKLITRTLFLLKDELISKNIAQEIIGDTSLSINVVENEFVHVLINILTNAKDAFVEREIKARKVVLEIIDDANFVHLHISDNAQGIPSHAIEHIFEPHYTTKKSSGGTGIGLYLAKQIIDKIGGTISVENKNHGARFTITLPKPKDAS